VERLTSRVLGLQDLVQLGLLDRENPQRHDRQPSDSDFIVERISDLPCPLPTFRTRTRLSTSRKHVSFVNIITVISEDDSSEDEWDVLSSMSSDSRSEAWEILSDDL